MSTQADVTWTGLLIQLKKYLAIAAQKLMLRCPLALRQGRLAAADGGGFFT